MEKQNSQVNSSLEIAARRKRQFWWQILLPVVLAALAVGTLSYLSTRASNQQISQWGNVSTMIVVLPVLLSCLVALAISVALIFGFGRLLQVLPRFFRMVQYRFHQIELGTRQAADKAAAPVIKTRSVWAGLRSVFRRE